MKILSKNNSNAHSLSAAPVGVHAHAVCYARLGLHVFPVQRNKKQPLANSHGWKDGTRSIERIARWYDPEARRPFRAAPHQTIAVATGSVSGVIVVDLDKREDKNGVAAWAKLEAKHRQLPRTWTSDTPSGGVHHYLAYPADRTVRTTHGELARGIDLQSDGALVVAPPTARDGVGTYRWRRGCAPWERALASMPEWLLDELRELEGSPRSKVMRPIAIRKVQAGSRLSYDDVLELAGESRRTDDNHARIRCPAPDHPGDRDLNCAVVRQPDGSAFVKCFSYDCDFRNIFDGLLLKRLSNANGPRLPIATRTGDAR